MKKIRLSIIIINYNTGALLKQCLESLGHGRWDKGDGEIIMVDNGSTDGSVEWLKQLGVKEKNHGQREKKFPPVHIPYPISLILNKENLGFAKANNQALKQARGKYILFLNSDTIVPKRTIPELITHLEKNSGVGVVTPKLKLRSGKIDPDCHRGFPTPWAAFCYFTGLEKLIPRSKIFGQYHQTGKDLNAIHEIDACCGAFLLTRKKILEKVGGFDESYFFYGEDLDFCFRIKQKGWKVIYYPKVSVIHYKGASSNLRKESKDIAKTSRSVRIKVAGASAQAMEIFYNKFYHMSMKKRLYQLIILHVLIFLSSIINGKSG